MPELEITTGLARIDLDLVHSWLTTAYWSPGVARERVERAAHNSSLVVGAFVDHRQVGYMRVVSDKTTFAWICDVWVDEHHRGKGIAKQMVKAALADPDHQGLRRWILATSDAHSIYAACGFQPLTDTHKWMILGQAIPGGNASGS